jgi:hypothetical protein
MECGGDYCGIQWKDTAIKWGEERSCHGQFQDVTYFLGIDDENQENVNKNTAYPQDSKCVLPGYKANTQQLFQNSQQLFAISYHKVLIK